MLTPSEYPYTDEQMRNLLSSAAYEYASTHYITILERENGYVVRTGFENREEVETLEDTELFPAFRKLCKRLGVCECEHCEHKNGDYVFVFHPYEKRQTVDNRSVCFNCYVCCYYQDFDALPLDPPE